MKHPSDALQADLASRLDGRQKAGLLRHLEPATGVDLTSNDYLGLASDPDLAQRISEAVVTYGSGSSASRLLRGHSALFERVENRLAQFCGRASSLIFSSGYAANVGLVSALAAPGDVIFSDSLNHASIIDGVRLSKAEKRIFPHQDLGALEALLQEKTEGRRIIMVESIYSMDGDLTDLEAICELAEAHQAAVIVDEAHATGCFGERGAGRVEELGLEDRVFATVHTGGKALGVAGAWIASCHELTHTLVNHARSFIFSTAPVPALVVGLEASVERLQQCGDRRRELWKKAEWLRKRLRESDFDLGACDSYIIPVIVGSTSLGMALAEALQREGFDVRAVRPPTVPEGTTRLRVTVRSNLALADLSRFADALETHWTQLNSGELI